MPIEHFEATPLTVTKIHPSMSGDLTESCCSAAVHDKHIVMACDNRVYLSRLDDAQILDPPVCYELPKTHGKINCIALRQAADSDQAYQFELIVADNRLLTYYALLSDKTVDLSHSRSWRHGCKGFIGRLAYCNCSRSSCSRVASVSTDGAVRVWNSQETSCLYSQSPCASSCDFLRFIHHDLIIAGLANQTLTIIKLQENNKHFADQVECSSRLVDFIRMSADTFVGLGSDELLSVWRLRADLLVDEDRTKLSKLETSSESRNKSAELLKTVAIEQLNNIGLVRWSDEGFVVIGSTGGLSEFRLSGSKLMQGRCASVACGNGEHRLLKSSDGRPCLWFCLEDANSGLTSLVKLRSPETEDQAKSLAKVKCTLISRLTEMSGIRFMDDAKMVVECGEDVGLVKGHLFERICSGRVNCFDAAGDVVVVGSADELIVYRLIETDKSKFKRLYCCSNVPSSVLSVALCASVVSSEILVATSHPDQTFALFRVIDGEFKTFAIRSQGERELTTVHWVKGSAKPILLTGSSFTGPDVSLAAWSISSRDIKRLISYFGERSNMPVFDVDSATCATPATAGQIKPIAAVLSKDQNIRIFNVETAECLHIIDGGGKVCQIRLDQEGGLYTTELKGTITKWTLKKPAKLWVTMVDPESSISVITLKNPTTMVVVSGGSLYELRDSSAQIEAEQTRNNEIRAKQKQLVNNLVQQADKKLEAIHLCLEMGGHQTTLLKLFQQLNGNKESLTDAVKNLSSEQLGNLMRAVIEWNCFAGQVSVTAQQLLFTVLTSYHFSDVLSVLSKQDVRALHAYTKRYRNRMERLYRAFQLMDFAG